MDTLVDMDSTGLGLHSCQGDDSNAIVLPEKKNKKKEKNKVAEKLKPKRNPKQSEYQKRKLKKIEEEKEKEILLSQSIEALEKYKIRDDLHSLMWSSRNLGLVETGREKRRREIQFSKAGLEVPYGGQPSKKRNNDDTLSNAEDESNMIQPSQLTKEIIPDSPPRAEKYVKKYTDTSLGSSEELVGSKALDDPVLDVHIPQEEVKDEINELAKQECGRSLLSSCSHIEESMKPNDKVDETKQVNLSNRSTPADRPAQKAEVTPTIVHVSRPPEVEDKRKDLPIVMMEQEIMEAINENISVIICGETGCGKTTQIPQFLYEAGFGSNNCSARGGIIGVTQPRRVAVLATAKRVAFELGLRLGNEVGFQVRHDRRVGDNCSIKFMTDGILLRELQNDFLLRRYSIIILDEAHERSLNTDILIGMLSRIIRERQKEYEKQVKKILSGDIIDPKNKIYPLKLILMSATLRVEDFISGKRIFHDSLPVIEVPTRQYPVTIHFSKKTEIVDYIGQAYMKILSIHKRLPPGGILVFVTGQREVEFLCRKLRKVSRERAKNVIRDSIDASSIPKENITEENDMKAFSEACEIQGNSGQMTDPFSSYDDDHGDLSDDNSDLSYDSGDDSDLEVYGDDGNLVDHGSQESDHKLENVLGEDGSLASLKSAFEDLAVKKSSNPCSDGRELQSLTPEGDTHNFSSLSAKEISVSDPCFGPMCILPLYAMLPASAQLRVFDAVKEGERLVVVATNVAETSLTIPGIKYVVDTGREKVKKYNPSNGIESYEVQWISKASAAQRAGRAGRTGPGHCYRLYSSAVFSNIFPDFSVAEILEVPVDGVVLLMKSMSISKVANFPFPTPPDATALVEAERCLKVLEALDGKGRLTALGKAMSQYPMSPRHSRMLLTVIQIMRKVKNYSRANHVLAYAVAAAAALSLSNPFVVQFGGTNSDELKHDQKPDAVESEKILEREEKLRKKKLKETAKASRAKFLNPTSDALTIAYALQSFELSKNPVEFCSTNALHLKTMEEMSKLRKQLLQLVFGSKFRDLEHEFSWTHGIQEDIEHAWRVSSTKHPLQLNEEEVLGQAICAGWADRVAKRTKAFSGLSEGERKVHAARYQACMVKETVFLHRWSSLSKFAPEFLVYSELLQSKRPYIHGATSVKPSWLVKYAQSLCTFSAPLTDPKPYYDPLTDQVFCWVIPTFGPYLWQLPLHSVRIEDDFTRVAVFACSLLEGGVLPCLKSVRSFMVASPASILRPESSGLKRVGNLLNKLRGRRITIDSCAMLRKIWDDNPRELYSEILDWFQEGFINQFEELWIDMQREVRLSPKERFPKRIKRERGKIGG